MGQFIIGETPLAGLKIITRGRVGDHRGFLSRLFCSTDLAEARWLKPVAQINHTFTRQKGTVRGMHFQRAPHSEMKLVSCIRGAVLDVGVDLRAGSSTFLQWHAEELTPGNGRALLIPEGFAHGFQALTDECELLYLHSSPYTSAAEAGVNPMDPLLGITWPLAIAEMSSRDSGHPMLNEYHGERL